MHTTNKSHKSLSILMSKNMTTLCMWLNKGTKVIWLMVNDTEITVYASLLA